MELRSYLAILLRRKWMIVVTTAITIIVAGIGTSFLTPTYQAATTLRVATSTDGTGGWGSAQYADRLMNTYLNVVTSDPVVREIMQRLALTEAPQVSVDIIPNTELMEIEVEHSSPEVAAQSANLLGELLVEQSRQVRELRSNPISVVAPAVAPQSASSPNLKLNLILAAIAGVMGGLGLVFVLENFDTTLYSAEDIESITNFNTLGTIPSMNIQQPIAFLNGPTIHTEAFRTLRTNLVIGKDTSDLQSMMITSAEPGEGKSTITANLAISLAQLGLKVLVVDADLRRPTQHKIFKLPNDIGLSNYLTNDASFTEIIRRNKKFKVHVISSGPRHNNPTELLSTDRSTELLAVADPSIIAKHVDNVLLVAGCNLLRKDAFESAQKRLSTSDAKSINVVVNRGQDQRSYQRYYN